MTSIRDKGLLIIRSLGGEGGETRPLFVREGSKERKGTRDPKQKKGMHFLKRGMDPQAITVKGSAEGVKRSPECLPARRSERCNRENNNEDEENR